MGVEYGFGVWIWSMNIGNGLEYRGGIWMRRIVVEYG